MTLSGLVDLITTEPTIAESIGDARARTLTALDLTAPTSLRPLLAAALAASTDRGGADRPVLLVTPTYREAEDLTQTLHTLTDPDQVAYYPPWETLPHERLSPRSDTVGRRLAVLRRLVHPDPAGGRLKIIVAPIRSVSQPQVKGLADLRPVRLQTGEDYDQTELSQALVDAAYVRVDLVERRGEFAVRGGIVDIFPPTEEHPIRVDFFGDTIEDIRYFAVADQRSSDDVIDEITADPCRELLLTDRVKHRAAALIDDHPELAEMLERIAAGHATDGMESLAPALVDGMELLVDLLPSDTHVLVCDPELVRTRSADLVKTSDEFLASSWAAAAGGGQAPIDLAASGYRSLAQVRESALDAGLAWWTLSPFSAAPTADATIVNGPVRTEDGEVVDFSDQVSTGGVPSRTVAAQLPDTHRGDAEKSITEIGDHARSGWRVMLVAEGHGTAERMTQMLSESDIGATLITDLTEAPRAGVVTVSTGELRTGLLADEIKLALYTNSDLSGQHEADQQTRKMPTRRKRQIDPVELAAGDPIVHEQHGVGRYVEMVQRTVAGGTREYLVIEYAASKRGQPGDRLFVPMDQLDLITRYVGGENPALDRMGGADWTKRKGRARKAVREIAAELIKLYAARQASRGYAFSPDTTWQRELEDAFGYVETPDQLTSVDEVKHDMEQIVPMDRLICGDVGYGKTEIAVRAAFKAIQDGKQVALLVPTTLLVQQHYETFADRYAGFPVKVAGLSRFNTDAEASQIITGVASGAVDLVIGTHRLLSSDISFKDLGLVIVDEEQRFGVEHKEKLKRLRTDVDVLAMSATPIPRTLEMAVTGIREMSTITTPPEERHPVLTFAGAYDEAQVAGAVRRELLREGQVFYIHNRVQSIDKTARRIAELVPEARVVTAHGQMSEQRLEQVMVDFWERRIDVLVCTTIIEAGLDISTANTLLIERADTMGLSQLHQLRGRVGRGRDRGYAYFLYPPEKPLSETAYDRLSTVATHSDLGAGMAVAMKDLEIRGAGNLLGGQQSGHIADVGFDLYVRLVGEAVAEFRGEDTEPEPEIKIELPIEAHLPTSYVETERLRLEMYKRIAEVHSSEELDEVRSELADRYGEPGAEVDNLLGVARFRLVARQAGLTDIVAQGKNVRFSPVHLSESQTVRLKRLYPDSIVKQQAALMLIPRPRQGRIGDPQLTGADLLTWCSEVVHNVLLP